MDATPTRSAVGGVVSQRAFQEVMARLVVDVPFRERVRSNGADVLNGDLTTLERKRLTAISRDRGLDATRTLYKGFRLSKLFDNIIIYFRLGIFKG